MTEFKQVGLPEAPEQSIIRTPAHVLTDILSRFLNSHGDIKELLGFIEELALSVQHHYAERKPGVALARFTQEFETSLLEDGEFKAIVSQDNLSGIARIKAIIEFIHPAYLKISEQTEEQLSSRYSDTETNSLKSQAESHLGNLMYGQQILDAVLTSLILIDKFYKYDLGEDSLNELSDEAAHFYSSFIETHTYQLTREETLAGEEYMENRIIAEVVPKIFNFDVSMEEMQYMSTSRALTLLQGISEQCQHYLSEIQPALSFSVLPYITNSHLPLPVTSLSTQEVETIAHCRTVQLLNNLATNTEISPVARVELIYSVVNNTTPHLEEPAPKNAEQPKSIPSTNKFTDFLIKIKNVILKGIMFAKIFNKKSEIKVSAQEEHQMVPVGLLRADTKTSLLTLPEQMKDPLTDPVEATDHLSEHVH